MKIRLTKKDIEVILFLARYKLMYGANAEKIYQSKGYHLKRLKALEKERYIKRYKRFYIKLDIEGTKLVKELGYENNELCREREYQERVKDIAKIAVISINGSITFLPSWEIKDSRVFTQSARKFIGEINCKEGKAIAYYINKDKEYIYIKQVFNDVQKSVEYKNVVIFVDNYKVLTRNNKYFIFGKQSTKIIKNTKENLERIVLFETVDFYDILLKIYESKEIMLSNWKKADYVTDSKEYIILMPFIDTEKLHRLNTFYNNNKAIHRKIDIITLKENISKIEEILTRKTNIIEIDSLVGGKHEEFAKV